MIRDPKNQSSIQFAIKCYQKLFDDLGSSNSQSRESLAYDILYALKHGNEEKRRLESAAQANIELIGNLAESAVAFYDEAWNMTSGLLAIAEFADRRQEFTDMCHDIKQLRAECRIRDIADDNNMGLGIVAGKIVNLGVDQQYPLEDPNVIRNILNPIVRLADMTNVNQQQNPAEPPLSESEIVDLRDEFKKAQRFCKEFIEVNAEKPDYGTRSEAAQIRYEIENYTKDLSSYRQHISSYVVNKGMGDALLKEALASQVDLKQNLADYRFVDFNFKEPLTVIRLGKALVKYVDAVEQLQKCQVFRQEIRFPINNMGFGMNKLIEIINEGAAEFISEVLDADFESMSREKLEGAHQILKETKSTLYKVRNMTSTLDGIYYSLKKTMETIDKQMSAVDTIGEKQRKRAELKRIKEEKEKKLGADAVAAHD